MRESTLKREIFMLGLSPRHKGFHYICAALIDLMNDEEHRDASLSLKRLAEVRHLDSKRAECCMRYAIRYAWDVSGGRIRELFPDSALPPTPIEFMHAMQWRLEEEML